MYIWRVEALRHTVQGAFTPAALQQEDATPEDVAQLQALRAQYTALQQENSEMDEEIAAATSQLAAIRQQSSSYPIAIAIGYVYIYICICE